MDKKKLLKEHKHLKVSLTNNLMLYWFLSGMFNPQSSFGSSTNSVDKLKEQLDKDEQESK